MSSPDYSQAVADILDGLGDSPTPDEVYHAVRNYSVDNVVAASAAAAKAGGGGGGGSQPLVASLSLTNAQMLALPGTPLTLAAAPGVGHGLVPIFAFVAVNLTANVTGIAADTDYPYIWIGCAGNQSLLIVAQDDPDAGDALTELLHSVSTPEVRMVYGNVNLTTLGGLRALSGTALVADFENLPLQIGAVNTGGNFTGGNAANAMTVTVTYLSVTLP